MSEDEEHDDVNIIHIDDNDADALPPFPHPIIAPLTISPLLYSTFPILQDFHYSDSAAKIVYGGGAEAKDQYALFMSSPVPRFASPAEKKTTYKSYFTMYNTTATAEGRRGICCLCQSHFSLKELAHTKAHLQKKHNHVLSPDDYTKADMESLKGQYDQAMKLNRTSVKPSFRNVDYDARKKANSGTLNMMAFAQSQVKSSKADGFANVFVEAVALGGFPTSLADNRGIQHMVKYLLSSDKVPKGISARSVKRKGEDLYNTHRKAKKKSMNGWTTHLSQEVGKNNVDIPKNVLHLIHDTWTARFNHSCLTGVKAAVMDSSDPQILKIRSVVMGMIPVVNGHDAASTETAICELLKEIGYSREDVISSVADITGSAKNVFKSDEGIVNIGCFAHLLALLLKHSLQGEQWTSGKFKKVDDRLKNCLHAINEVSVKISGSKPTLELLYAQEKILGMKKMIPPLIHFPVRWNSSEKMASAFLQIKDAVNQLNTAALFPNDSGTNKAEKIAKYDKNLETINNHFPILIEFLPFMQRVALWTQVLSSSHRVTISKVLVARQDIVEQIRFLGDRAALLQHGRRASEGFPAVIVDAATKEVGSAMSVYVKILWSNMDHYFAEEFYMNSIYQMGSYLDPSTWMNLPAGVLDMKLVTKGMKKLCATFETFVPEEDNVEIPDDDDTPAFMRDVITLPAVRSSARRNVIQKKSLLEAELAAFSKYILTKYPSKSERANIDPLELYACQDVQKLFPIHYRIALVVLPAPATSSDVERLFSLSGRVFSVARASLKSETGGMWVCLKSWLQGDLEETSRRVKAADVVSKRFASLVASNTGLLSVVAGDNSPDKEAAAVLAQAAIDQHALNEKAEYEGNIETCPTRIPKDLVEGSRVAVYFDEKKKWFKGKLYHVAKTPGRQKGAYNCAVLFDDGENHHFLWKSKDQYGKKAEFVVISDGDEYESDESDDKVGGEDEEEVRSDSNES